MIDHTLNLDISELINFKIIFFILSEIIFGFKNVPSSLFTSCPSLIHTIEHFTVYYI